MGATSPNAQIEASLLELKRELTGLGVRSTVVRDREGWACLDAYDRFARRLRVHLFVQSFLFVWGDEFYDRHSMFDPAEAAVRLACLALGPGWPGRPR